VLNIPVALVAEKEVRVEMRAVPAEPYDLIGVPVQTPAGKLSAKLGLHPEDGEPFEAWLDVSRAGTAMNADREAMARLVSLVLRIDSSLSPERRLQLVVEQLDGIGGGDSAGFGPHKVLSVPDGIAKAFRLLLERLKIRKSGTVQAPPRTNAVFKDLCPQCHQVELYRAEGCMKCAACFFSQC
jgi:ribonucleoside-diphosphate reductase alpha chain